MPSLWIMSLSLGSSLEIIVYAPTTGYPRTFFPTDFRHQVFDLVKSFSQFFIRSS